MSSYLNIGLGTINNKGVLKMSKKGMHLWAAVKDNAGDFILGPATRFWFEKHVLRNEVAIEWTKHNCRSKFYTQGWVENLNQNYDYLVVGGGGLFLPDSKASVTSPSRWQWRISTADMSLITIPIYVVSVGYNLFYNQTVAMPFKDNSQTRRKNTNIFKESVETLINKSEYFSMRHHGDIQNIKELLDESVHDKIHFQFCPTIEFSQEVAELHNIHNDNRKIWAIEIKDDRKFRRYYNTSGSKVYADLMKFIVYMKQTHNIEIKTFFQDNSRSFHRYLKKKKINFGAIDNTRGNVKERLKNYANVDVLFCMAGHSQMIGHAMGCRIVSLITHNKLKYFLEDIGEYKDNNYVDINKDNIYDKLVKIGEHLVKEGR